VPAAQAETQSGVDPVLTPSHGASAVSDAAEHANLATTSRRAPRALLWAPLAVAIALALAIVAAEAFAPANDALASTLHLDVRAGMSGLFSWLQSVFPH